MSGSASKAKTGRPPETSLFFLLALLMFAGDGFAQLPEPRPNIILLMSDDQGYGDAGYRGHETLQTPALDRMAREGVVFERFYAAAPVCSPTRASCLTGLHPHRVGITGANTGHLPADVPQLATTLRAAGYTTGHFGKWHLGTLTKAVPDANRGGPRNVEHYAPPWERGFDTCFSTESKVPTWDPLLVPREGLGATAGTKGKAPGEPYGTAYWTGPGEQAQEGMEGDDSHLIVERALTFIEAAAARDQPFLAVIWFHAPHLPAIAGGSYLERYAELSMPERHYYGCITALDASIGLLRERLAEADLTGDTLLWFTSDNGPERGVGGESAPGRTQGLRARKRSLHEGGVRVPGLLIWPDRWGPRTVTAPASTSDIFPTLLDVLGLPALAGLDGASLRPQLEGESTTRDGGIAFDFGKQRAWIQGRYKLYSSDRGESYALYDLLSDPGEENDLAREEPERLQSLRASWEAWKATF